MSGPGFAPPPPRPPGFQAPQFQGPQFQAPQFTRLPLSGPQAPREQPPVPAEVLRSLPAPSAPWPVRPPGPPQRPAVIALACTLAVMGSLQWICALSLLWVTASVGVGAFAEVNDNGALFHILNRFNYRMLDGLAVPLYLFPLASIVTGFLLLSRRPWTRTLHTVVGAAALAWAAWWLRDDLLWWFSAAWYVVVACLVLWTPAATAWYRWREEGPDRPLA